MRGRVHASPMRLRHAEVLRAVMISGTVSGAAQLLNMSQPAATRALQQAEDALGFRLFVRTRGRMVPTPEGQALHLEAERIFAGLDHLQRLASGLRAGGGGRLRVATAPALSLDALPGAVAGFRRQFPDILLEIETLHTKQIAEGVLLRELDLGFAFDPPPHPGLVVNTVTTGDLIAIFPPNHTGRGECRLADLVGFPFIGLRGGDPLGSALATACNASDVVLDPAVEVQTYHVALSLVAQGVGAAVVDCFTAASAVPGAVIARPIVPAVPFSVVCVHAGHRPLSNHATHLVELFHQALREIGINPIRK